MSKVDEYIGELDTYLKMNNKLSRSFKAAEQFPDTPKDEVLAFETFYDRLKKWAVTEQTELDYDDFAGSEDEQYKKE